MDIPVSTAIADLLYERDLVIVPGLGAFSGKYKSAVVDPVQEVVQPPSKQISFNPNLSIDDGVLVEYISKKHLIDIEDAEKAVKYYIDGLRNRLQRKEIVAIPDVGRIYVDFEKKMQFLPDKTNFNKDAFGLPTVSMTQPPQPQADTVATQQPAEPKPVPAPQPRLVPKPAPLPASAKPSGFAAFAKWSYAALPFLMVAALVLIGISMFFFWPKNSLPDNAPDGQRTEIESRLNSKPAPQTMPSDSANTTGAAVEPIAETPAPMQIPVEATRQPQSDTPPAPGAPTTTGEGVVSKNKRTAGSRECIIIIGGFGDPANVKRLVSKIEKAGFEAYTDRRGNLTRVGVRFGYQDAGEIDQTLAKVHEKFHPKAWILRQ
jgi:cell division septation protein DedD